jgi:hypothetical protein
LNDIISVESIIFIIDYFCWENSNISSSPVQNQIINILLIYELKELLFKCLKQWKKKWFLQEDMLQFNIYFSSSEIIQEKKIVLI